MTDHETRGTPEPLRFDERARGGNLLAGVLGRLAVTVPGLLVGAGLLSAVALGAPGWLVWMLSAAFVIGLAMPVWALARVRRLVGVLELGTDQVSRTVAGERLGVGWADVRALTLVANYLTGETLVVLDTEPTDALLPRSGRWLGRCLGRWCARLYGGAIVVPLTACGLPDAEARELVTGYADRFGTGG